MKYTKLIKLLLEQDRSFNFPVPKQRTTFNARQFLDWAKNDQRDPSDKFYIHPFFIYFVSEEDTFDGGIDEDLLDSFVAVSREFMKFKEDKQKMIELFFDNFPYYIAQDITQYYIKYYDKISKDTKQTI